MVDGELIACRHLEITPGAYRCRIYTTRPAVCHDYDCMRNGDPSPAVADRVANAARQLHESAQPPAPAQPAVA